MNTRLEAITNLTGSINLISKTISHLNEKRVTLEEKMIIRYFHEMSEKLALILSLFHRGEYQKELRVGDEILESINNLCLQNNPVVEELKKAIEYNWNYLEQYFEHGFYGRLVDEHKFLIKISSIIETIQP